MSDVIQFKDHKPAPRKGMGYQPPPTSSNWLVEMAEGTRFLAKRKGDGGSLLTQFIVCTDPKAMPVVMLGESIDNVTGTFNWRVPELFSQDWDFHYTLEIMDKHGNSNKVQPGPVESHGNDPGSN